MSSIPHPDLAGLAMLARNGDRELRPVLLTLHTREFVSSAVRDRRRVATYEALALGLIPLVPDDVVAEVAAMLRLVPETPPRVLDLLAERRAARSIPDPLRLARSATLGRQDMGHLLAAEAPEIDLALARNTAVPLDAEARQILLERAVRNGELARALLDRPDLSGAERGALFGFAAEAGDRDLIREELERAASAAPAAALPALSEWRRGRLLRAAGKADMPALLGEIAKALGLAEPPLWRADHEAEAELFALSLVAAGLTVEDCVHVLLTADHRIAASVPAVFRLRQVCRTTSRGVACQLVGAMSKPVRTGTSAAGTRPKKAEGARAVSATEPARRVRPASAPGDRRSRSTTGRDRT
jgi:hypothetical protein